MSNTATMQVSSDQDEITSEIEIAVPPERVFQALVDPQQVMLWWGQTGVYRCTEFQSELRPGGKWRSAGIGPEGRPFQVTGEYLEVAPPRLLVHTWVASWTGEAQTTVRWELQTTATGRACLDGFKRFLKRKRPCSTGKRRRFAVELL